MLGVGHHPHLQARHGGAADGPMSARLTTVATWLPAVSAKAAAEIPELAPLVRALTSAPA